MLDISLGRNAFVEHPCLVPDGFEITGRELDVVGQSSFRLLTRIILPTARAGALARGNLLFYPTVS
jgi:hypothetical protein